MAVNFNLLSQAGPANFYEGLVQGQEQQRVNALTQQKMAQEQQKMAQEQEMNALRMQQTRGAINQQEREVKSQAVAQKTAMFRDRLLRARDPNSVRELVKMQYADPDVGAVLSQGSTLEQALAEVPDDPTQFEQYRQQEAMGMSEWMKSQMPKVAGNRVFDPRTRSFIEPPQAAPVPEKTPTSADATTMQALGFPLTPDGYRAFRDAQRVERLLTPEEEAQKTRIALASRPPGAPRPEPAPSITNIVDPTNPNQMIAIDTRRYQGGGVGSLGVIGASGKEPGAAVRTNKDEAGKTQLADDLENLRASFETLDRLRAIPSTERGALSNVTSGIASTAIGQRTGQFFATEAQVERDVINSARSRLVNSIKNATGMSAQQLNSNVELQTMLKSISDPGQSYQSALRIIEDIENAYVKGSGMTPKSGKPGTPKPSGGAPPPPPGFKSD
jgi:hypothetical protein